MKAIREFTIGNYSFEKSFKAIINNKRQGYDRGMEGLKSFLEDIQQGGCVNGMIGSFIYHSDCKKFYIKHIDDLEAYKEQMEGGMGETIENRFSQPHYTFVVWLCFEEYCYRMYNEVFEG